MSQKLRSYSAQRKAGLPDVDNAPGHWTSLTVRNLTVLRNARNRPDLPLLSVYREYGVIPKSSREDNHNADGADLTTYKVVSRGDLVLNKMKTWQGSLGISEHNGIVSPAYLVCRVNDRVHGPFLHYLLRSRPYISYYNRISFGIRIGQWDMRYSDFRETPVALPPSEEQQAIANFLANFDQRINRLIRIKRRYIELLNEQKQAIIHRAVTRGLDPDVPLKPSGIDWLGDVPAHWKVVRLKTLVARFDQGISPQAEAILADSASWGVVKAGCVNGGQFQERQHKRLPASFVFPAAAIIRVGDVLVSRASGSPRLVGSTGRVRELSYRLILSDKTFRLNFRDNVRTDFFVTAMNSHYYRRQVTHAISGAEGLANNLPLTALKNFSILTPPSCEAMRICEHLDSRLRALRNLITSHGSAIDALIKYRARVLADVVTGQLDVQSHPWSFACLGEGIEDPELIEELANAD